MPRKNTIIDENYIAILGLKSRADAFESPTHPPGYEKGSKINVAASTLGSQRKVHNCIIVSPAILVCKYNILCKQSM